jgi:organic radical activating enzyme
MDNTNETSNVPDFTPGRPLRTYGRGGTYYDYSTDDLVGEYKNNFLGWRCGLGVDSLYIDMDGNIFGASCRQGGSYGNIYEDFQTPKDWSICARKLCSCGADLFIPKYKEAEDKELLIKTFSLPTSKDLTHKRSDRIDAVERTHQSSLKQVYWEIGRRCNYDCSYCWPFIHNKTDAHKTLLELLTATEKIFDQFAQGQTVNFIISGGEPTLNPAFMDWVRYISSQGHALSMHSNGSRLPDYYRELIHYGNLNLSAHFEFFSLEKFVKTVAAITDEKMKNSNFGVGHLEVKAMMAPGRRLEALRLRDEVEKIPFFKEFCTFAFVPIRDGKMGDQVKEGYEEEDFALFGV